jgi:uncharacterized protein YaaN involved in tellurite resistance
VSIWGEVFLGIIAFASLLTAVMQVGALIAAARLAMRLEKVVGRIEQEIKPLAAHLDQMGRDASRMTAIAAVQVERVDALFADLIGRLESTLDAVQSVVSKPAREGAAIWAAVRAMLSVLRSRSNRGSRADDEDALFI